MHFFRPTSFFALLFFFTSVISLPAAPIQVGHVSVELLSETESIQPGQPFTVGFLLKMDPHWHTYWKNPGDSGLPTSIDWKLPPGFSAGAIQWPLPQLIKVDTLVGYGYENQVLLPVTITTPADLQPGATVSLNATIQWLVCREECIPGKADLTIRLPVKNSFPQKLTANAELFSATHAQLPQPFPIREVNASENNGKIDLRWKKSPALPPLQNPYFFADDPAMVNSNLPQSFSDSENVGAAHLELTRPSSVAPLATLSGILVSEGKAWEISVPLGSVQKSTFATTLNPESTSEENQKIQPVRAGDEPFSLLGILISAFFGGLILNLMPCVLPVLSVKVLNLVKHAEEKQDVVWKQSLAFTLGVLVSFWALDGVLLAFQMAGKHLGWGFQMQSPVFVMLLAILFFIFALNLFGVFEIGVSLVGIDTKAAQRSGFFGSFGTGALATLAATPCTAPYMGVALGATLSQSFIVGFLVFTALGLGMAAPYLVLGFFPQLLKFVPKPGAWMETFKQFLAFLLMGTVIFYLYVFSQETGEGATVALLGALLVIGFSAWIYGKWATPIHSFSVRIIAIIFAVIFFFIGLVFAYAVASSDQVPARLSNATASARDSENSIEWEPFSPQRLAELRAQDTPVFIDFTAAWCLSCKVNEFAALKNGAVIQKIKEKGIVTMKADWTRYDPSITQILNQFGRTGVPLYLLYGRDPQQPPQILPEVITPGIVLDAIDKIK